MLLTKDSVDSHTLMNLPYMYNPKLYESLYIDRNVNALIKGGMIIDEESEEDNSPLSEAMMHIKDSDRIKVTIDAKLINPNDIRLAKSVFNEKTFLKWYRFFNANTRHICTDVTIDLYPSVKEMVKANQGTALANKDIISYSYSYKDRICVVANSGYADIKSKDGPDYEKYLLNELITFVCMHTSRNCSRFLAGQIATALSGQLTKELIGKIKNNWGEQKDYGLATAYVIKTMYDKEGRHSVVELCKTGDINILGKYAAKGFINRISGIYEATLTAADRKALNDTDYGLPKLRKYPMPDESHVRSAIRFFNHVSKEDEAELARNIKKKIKAYGMSVEVGEDNRFSKYYKGSKNESSLVLESLSFTEKDKRDLKQIIDSFSDKEKEYVGNAYFITNFKPLYKEIKYVNGKPVGFITVVNRVKGPYGFVILGVHKDYRGSGIASSMAIKMIKHFNASKELNAIIWNIDFGNEASEKTAKKVGFEFFKKYNTYNEYVYKIASSKNESSLVLETAEIDVPLDKIAVGTDFHFINYNEDKTKIVLKPESYMKAVVEKEKSIAGNNGIFIYLGDIIFKSFRDEGDIPVGMKETVIKYIKQFTGKYKIFIRGNHDNMPDEFYLETLGFTHICSSLDYNDWLFTHQPEIVRDPKKNIHGHIHGSRIYTESKPKNYIDVWTINSLHIDSLENILKAQPKYDENIKQAPNVMKANPHQHIVGKALELEDIVTESAVNYDDNNPNIGNISVWLISEYNENKSGDSRYAIVFDNRENDKTYYMDTDWINNSDIKELETSIQNEYNKLHEQRAWGNIEIYPNIHASVFKVYPGQYMDMIRRKIERSKVDESVIESPASSVKDNFEDVMKIVDSLSEDERKIIAIKGKYKDSDDIISRKIAYDEEGNPVGFIDIYWFNSMPFECQLTAACKPEYRGKGYMSKLLGDIINYSPNGHPGVTKYVWNVDPENAPSINLAKKHNFRRTGTSRYRRDLDIYEDRYEYAIPFKETAIPTPQKLLRESFNSDGYICTEDYIMDENSITFFNGMDDQFITEAEKKYDSKLKRYLFAERLKNNKAVLLRYQQMRAMNPGIKYTFLKLATYKKKNLFIDLSFYHGLFLEHLKFKKDAAINMYWDFLNRLIADSEYKSFYNRITIFIPIWAEAWDVNNAEELMNYTKSINPVSMIIRMLRKNPNELKKWGSKDILFVSPKGYFKVNFNAFDIKNISRFKTLITKLFNQEVEEEDEDGYTPAKSSNGEEIDSASVITAKVVDKIEANAGIKIDDITGGSDNRYQPDETKEILKPSKEEFTHLRIRTGNIDLPTNIKPSEDIDSKAVKNAVLIMSPDRDKAVDSFLKSWNNRIFTKKGYFSP